MKEMNFCQSCGVPMETEEMKGTNKDQSKSQEYCAYCFKDGAFTQEMTMDEMISLNLQYVDEWNKGSDKKYTAEEIKQQLEQFLPTLKRWKTEE